MPQPNQVEVQVQPSQDGSGVTMSISAPDGAMDIQLSIEQAAGILMDLTKVLGQIGGVDVSQEFSGLGQEGGMPQSPGDGMGGTSGPLGTLG